MMISLTNTLSEITRPKNLTKKIMKQPQNANFQNLSIMVKKLCFRMMKISVRTISLTSVALCLYLNLGFIQDRRDKIRGLGKNYAEHRAGVNYTVLG